MTLMLIFDFQFFVKSVISYKNDNTDSDFGTLILIYNRIIAYIVVVGLLLDGRLVVLKDSDGWGRIPLHWRPMIRQPALLPQEEVVFSFWAVDLL
jgi:hypothetical protein